jgi:serine/threonine protein phosphatase PrpC
VDQKARRQDEQDRIRSQGGYIVQGRVLGRLAVSRAIGDYDCKNIEVPVKKYDEDGKEVGEEKVMRNFILNEPEVRVIDIDPLVDDFFFIASDGLFDRYSSKDCVKLFRKKLAKMEVLEQDTQKVVQEVVECAKAKRVNMDNITIVLVALNRGVESTKKSRSSNS